MESDATQWSTLEAFHALADRATDKVEACVQTRPSRSLVFRFALHGEISRLRIPTPQAPGRAEHLWEHTCFEAFIKQTGSPAYHEFNFAPSRQWAVYGFDDYRKAISSPRLERPPQIDVRRTNDRLELDAFVDVQDLIARPAPRSLQIGLSAIIEDREGSLSYWALKHAPDKPDFHSAVAFALNLSV